MKALGTKLGLTAATALLALPSAAAAQAVVPPGNSAVNQYTETVPTARGSAKTRHHGKRSPAKVLGADNARRLEAAAPQGRAVAEVVAATAPVPAPSASKADRGSGHPATHAAGPGGSSGLGKVITAATGSSDSGELGLLLPLLIVCALVGSAAYFWRQKRRTA